MGGGSLCAEDLRSQRAGDEKRDALTGGLRFALQQKTPTVVCRLVGKGDRTYKKGLAIACEKKRYSICMREAGNDPPVFAGGTLSKSELSPGPTRGVKGGEGIQRRKKGKIECASSPAMGKVRGGTKKCT